MTPWPKNENQRSLQDCANFPQAASQPRAGGEELFTRLHICLHLASFTHAYRLSGGAGWGPEKDGAHQALHSRHLPCGLAIHSAKRSVHIPLFPHSFPKSVPGILQGLLGKSHNNLKEPACPENSKALNIVSPGQACHSDKGMCLEPRNTQQRTLVSP